MKQPDLPKEEQEPEPLADELPKTVEQPKRRTQVRILPGEDKKSPSLVASAARRP